MIDIISLVFSQDFLMRALFVGVLISLCCALLGVSLVLIRFSMIGDGLSHVGFGAMAIACAANIAPLYFSLPIVIVAAFLLLKMNDSGKIKGDAAIALISTGALAIGVMATSMTTGMNVDIYNYMFGSILTMSNTDVIISASVSLVIIILFVVFYNEIFAVTFDESFAKATGTKVSFYNMLIAALTAVTIVIGMRMMGALLISSLIIFPTVSSMRICKSFRNVVVSSTLVSILCFITGLLLSIAIEAPTGASVVCINIIAFIFLSITGKINQKYSSVLRIFFIAILSVCLLLMFFCVFTFTGRETAKKDRISIVTTAFVHYDFAKQICADKADITMLLSPGEESHTYEPTPADIMKIKECDVFIYTGGESETWVEDIISSTNTDFECVKFIDCVHLEHEDEYISQEHSHDESCEHTHEHETEYDEHVWTSPLNAITLSEAVYNAVIKVDKENRDYYTSNYKTFQYELKKLDNDFRSMVTKSNSKPIVIADRFPLMYLFNEYNIEYLAAYPGCSAQVQANPVTIAFLNEKIKTLNIDTVFKIDMSKGEIAYSISESTNVNVDTLYSCHMVSANEFKSGVNYLTLMRKNLQAIENALS